MMHEDHETRAKDEINICTDLKCSKMPLTNGMLPNAFAKGVIEVAKMQESGGNMVLNETGQHCWPRIRYH